MGCGCSKGGNRNTGRSVGGVYPSNTTNRSVSPQNANNQQNVNSKNLTQQNIRNINSTDRRNIEKIRREAIRRALGR